MRVCLGNKKSSDNAKGIIYEEIKLYLSEQKEKMKYDKGYFHFNVDGEEIWISGDNLITYKQMYRRMHHKRKLPDDFENSQGLPAYIIMPFIKGNRNSNVNIKRAAVSGYNDNPLAFLITLRSMYESDFNINDSENDPVKKSIQVTKKFWLLFGQGKEGYYNYLLAFKLNCIKRYEDDEKYRKYYAVYNFEKGDWPLYKELLEKIITDRSHEFE